MTRHVYEEVNSMTFNPRYLTHNSHITSGGHSLGDSTGVPNPLHSLKEAEANTYSYAVCTPTAKAENTLSSCAETDTYELMKPSGSVRKHKIAIPTTDNVCYTSDGH